RVTGYSSSTPFFLGRLTRGTGAKMFRRSIRGSGGGSSFDESQRPSHGPRSDRQHDRGCEHQTQQTEQEHTLAHVGALSTKAEGEAGRSDTLTGSAQPSPTSWPLGWSTPPRRQMRI